MKSFVRMTKLGDIQGRQAYIDNDTKQHDSGQIILLGSSADMQKRDWTEYATFEKEHQRSSEPNNEGRELILKIPKEWLGFFQKAKLKERVENLIGEVLGKSSDFTYAVHLSKNRSNPHVHVIFSERSRNTEFRETGKSWDRDIYLTEDGKVAKRKADRRKDENGNILPPIHRKGEKQVVGDKFTHKDEKFKSKAWLQATKKTIATLTKAEEPALIAQKHIGKSRKTSKNGFSADKTAEMQQFNDRAFKVSSQWIDFERIYRFKEDADKEKFKELLIKELKKLIQTENVDLFRPSQDSLIKLIDEFCINIKAEKEAIKQQKREDKEYEKFEKMASKELDKAYELAIEVYNGRISRDLPYNNHKFDALKELTGEEFGTYDKKRHPKLEKQLEQSLAKIRKYGKSGVLYYRLDEYFKRKLPSIDNRYSKANLFSQPYEYRDYLLSTVSADLQQQRQREIDYENRKKQEREEQLQKIRMQNRGPSLKELMRYAEERKRQEKEENRERDVPEKSHSSYER